MKSKDESDELFALMAKLKRQDKFHLAYLVFQNNLNLFMLESYLVLCNRLDQVRESHESFKSFKSLF